MFWIPLVVVMVVVSHLHLSNDAVTVAPTASTFHIDGDIIDIGAGGGGGLGYNTVTVNAAASRVSVTVFFIVENRCWEDVGEMIHSSLSVLRYVKRVMERKEKAKTMFVLYTIDGYPSWNSQSLDLRVRYTIRFFIDS